MVKQKAKDIKKEIEEQKDEVYGDETISGSSPSPESDDDVEETLEDVLGIDAIKESKVDEPFTLAEEVEEDEEKRRTKPELHHEDED